MDSSTPFLQREFSQSFRLWVEDDVERIIRYGLERVVSGGGG